MPAREVLDLFTVWKNAQRARILFVARPIDDHLIYISSFDIKPQGTGIGTRALRHLQRLCQADNVSIELEAVSENPLPDEEDEGEMTPEQSRLEGWYIRLGFEYTDEIGDSGGPIMRWKP